MSRKFVAIDLGASSGRAVLGELADRLSLTEVHRFANGPIAGRADLRWDAPRLESNILAGVAAARERAGKLDGVGVDSWGVDYVLLGGDGEPVDLPHHYRDGRTEGVMERTCKRFGKDFIFGRTGIQFMPFNTIYQLLAEEPAALRRAERLVFMADYFSHRLRTGGIESAVSEITLASTSQLLDGRTRAWSDELIGRLGLRRELMPPLVEAGTVLGSHGDVPVIATAAHDTAAAVAGTPGEGNDWAFLSCGTWAILGLELPGPVIDEVALAADVSNEAGVFGTTRLLRNIMGLWLLQECRRAWAGGGKPADWDDLVAQARAATPLAAVIDPDDPQFLAPDRMPEKIAEFCRRTNQPPPDSVGGVVRGVIEALALKTRWNLDRLEKVSGCAIRKIHVVGGGVNNALLCQLTADATGRCVLAGPVEATATGNVLVQAIGAGAISSLAEARALLRRSIQLREYSPRPSQAWEDAYGKLVELTD